MFALEETPRDFHRRGVLLDDGSHLPAQPHFDLRGETLVLVELEHRLEQLRALTQARAKLGQLRGPCLLAAEHRLRASENQRAGAFKVGVGLSDVLQARILKINTAKLGACEVRAGEVRLAKAGAIPIGARKIRMAETRLEEIRLLNFAVLEVGVVQDDLAKVGFVEARALEVGSGELGATQLRVLALEADELGPAEICVFEFEATEDTSLPKIGTDEARIAQPCAGKMSAAEVGPTEARFFEVDAL